MQPAQNGQILAVVGLQLVVRVPLIAVVCVFQMGGMPHPDEPPEWNPFVDYPR